MSATPPRAQMFERLEAPLAPLERLPRGLWLWSLVHSQGALEARLPGIEALRTALLEGVLPSPAWPGGALGEGIATTLTELDLHRYCAGRTALSDTVLRSLLWHLDLIVDYCDRGAETSAAEAMALECFAEDWRERTGMIDELGEVLGDPGDIKTEHWDRLRGLLRSEGWREALRIRRLIEDLPGLARLIRGLGRSAPGEEFEDAPADGSAQEQITEAPRAETRVTRVPELPGETRGVHRSDRIARMLPSEALLLGHPRLRLVWHARRAERTLLSYEDDDRLRETLPRPRPATLPQRRRRLEAGPMLICVDTSGSMNGGAEAVAKAVVLEAARVAHAQRRPCHVFAFGGPDEIVELELGFEPAGLERLVRFIGQGFHGGTDICLPLARSLARLAELRWRQADLLIASDGEFGATAALAAAVDEAKATLGLRVQAVLIGDRETVGLLELADAVFWVRDWRRFGGSKAASPVHDKSLTALYFPGALRSPQNRAATVDGDRAARAVRSGKTEDPK
ncbi:MAG: VWA domain-containing protein [Rhodocyclaceae bacterium]